MLIDFLISNQVITAFIVVVLSLFDRLSSVWFSKVSQTMRSYVEYIGTVELNLRYETEIDKGIWISWKYIGGLVGVFFAVIISGFVGTAFFELFIGIFVLQLLRVSIKHVSNYYFVWLIKIGPNAISGKRQETLWFSKRITALEAFIYGIFCFLLWAETSRLFFMAGFLSSWLLSVGYFLASNKEPKTVKS